MNAPPSAHFLSTRRLHRHWRGLLLLALGAVLLSQSFGLIHRLDAVHHPAEALCEICAHAGHGSAPLASLPQLALSAPQAGRYILSEPLVVAAFRIQPPPARGPPHRHA